MVAKSIKLRTNDRNHPTVTLEGATEIRTPFDLEDTMIQFGQLAYDAAPTTQKITLRRGDGGPIAPKVVSTGHPQVKAVVTEQKAGELYELAVTLSPPWPARLFRSLLKLETGVPESPSMNLAVFASIEARLSADPTYFSVKMNTEKETVYETRLVWTGDKPGKAQGVTLSNEELRVELVDKDDGQLVRLTVPPGFQPERKSGSLVTVSTNDSHAPELTIPIFWRRADAKPAVGK